MATVTTDAVEMATGRWIDVRTDFSPWARTQMSEAENVAFSELPAGSFAQLVYGGSHTELGSHWCCQIWTQGERIASRSADIHDAIYGALLAVGILV